MAGDGPEEIAPETPVHRIGGVSIANLQLKPREKDLETPGISIFLGATAQDAARQVRDAFPNATRLIAATSTVATATAGAIRRVGFDVVRAPTRRFANHDRLLHPDGADGFSDENLQALSRSFGQTAGADHATQS